MGVIFSLLLLFLFIFIGIMLLRFIAVGLELILILALIGFVLSMLSGISIGCPIIYLFF